MHSFAMSIGSQALVLKEFKIQEEGPEYVHIVARKAGLISWLLTIFGVDTTTIFKVFNDRIEFQEGSLSGQVQMTMPLRSVSIASTGYTKPIVLLILAFIFLLAAIPTFGITLIFSIICFVYYFLNKSLMIAVVSNSSWPATISFKRSVIEGVKIEYEQAQKVIDLINRLLMEQASK